MHLQRTTHSPSSPVTPRSRTPSPSLYCITYLLNHGRSHAPHRHLYSSSPPPKTHTRPHVPIHTLFISPLTCIAAATHSMPFPSLPFTARTLPFLSVLPDPHITHPSSPPPPTPLVTYPLLPRVTWFL